MSKLPPPPNENGTPGPGPGNPVDKSPDYTWIIGAAIAGFMIGLVIGIIII